MTDSTDDISGTGESLAGIIPAAAPTPRRRRGRPPASESAAAAQDGNGETPSAPPPADPPQREPSMEQTTLRLIEEAVPVPPPLPPEPPAQPQEREFVPREAREPRQPREPREQGYREQGPRDRRDHQPREQGSRDNGHREYVPREQRSREHGPRDYQPREQAPRDYAPREPVEPQPPREPLPAVNLTELKRRPPAELLRYAEELGIDSASTLKKSDLVFAILKRLAETDVPINGEGVLEILQDGFGFLRSPDVNYVAGPDDVYVSPSQIRRFAPAHRRCGPGSGPGAQGGRALLRAAAREHDQFRHARGRPAPRPFRQPDALLPDAEAQSRGRRAEGRLDPDHRDRGAAGQGPAGADRGAAQDRQDRADAEHRARDHGQSPRHLPDRAARSTSGRKRSPTCSARCAARW